MKEAERTAAPGMGPGPEDRLTDERGLVDLAASSLAREREQRLKETDHRYCQCSKCRTDVI